MVMMVEMAAAMETRTAMAVAKEMMKTDAWSAEGWMATSITTAAEMRVMLDVARVARVARVASVAVGAESKAVAVMRTAGKSYEAVQRVVAVMEVEPPKATTAVP